jgi:hypothetical protein
MFGVKFFWDKIYNTEDFFFSLKPMDDAYDLVNAVRHLNPIILTGKPKGDWGESQKLRWRDKYFSNLEMIVCKSDGKDQVCEALVISSLMIGLSISRFGSMEVESGSCTRTQRILSVSLRN